MTYFKHFCDEVMLALILSTVLFSAVFLMIVSVQILSGIN